MGSITYSLLDRYTLALNARGDGSSMVGASNTWGFFPSISFTWDLKKENFLINVKPLSDAQTPCWRRTGRQPWRHLCIYHHEHRKADRHCPYQKFADSNTWHGEKQQSRFKVGNEDYIQHRCGQWDSLPTVLYLRRSITFPRLPTCSTPTKSRFRHLHTTHCSQTSVPCQTADWNSACPGSR